MKISLVLVVVVFFLNKINIFLSHLFCEGFFLLIKVKEILFHKIIIIEKNKEENSFFFKLIKLIFNLFEFNIITCKFERFHAKNK